MAESASEAPVLEVALSQGTRRFGNHRRNGESGEEGKKKRRERFWFLKIFNFGEAASV